MDDWRRLKRKTAGNLVINMCAAVGSYGIQFAVNIVVARWLLPSEVGIVGMALVFSALALQVGDFGILAAAVQRKDWEKNLLEAASFIRLVAAVCAVVLVFALSPWTSSIAASESVSGVVQLLSVIPLINFLGFAPQVLLTRTLDYRKLAAAQLAGSLAGGATTIILAKTGWGFWSIAIGQMLNAVATTAYYRSCNQVRVEPRWHGDAGRALLRFGWGIFLPSLMVFVIMNIDNFTVGAVRGVAELGLYAVSFNWGSMMPVVAAVIVHRVLSPTLCRLQDDREMMRSVYKGSLAWIAFIAVPCNLLLALHAEPFLVDILGRGTTKWLQATPVFVILCLYGIIRALLEPVANVFTATGNTGAFILPNLAAAVTEAALVYPAAKLYGLQGVAIVVTGAYLVQYPFYMRRLKDEIRFGISDFIRITTPALVAGAGMAAVILWMRSGTPFHGRILFAAAAGTVAYILMHGVLTRWSLVLELRELAGKRAVKLHDLG